MNINMIQWVRGGGALLLFYLMMHYDKEERGNQRKLNIEHHKSNWMFFKSCFAFKFEMVRGLVVYLVVSKYLIDRYYEVQLRLITKLLFCKAFLLLKWRKIYKQGVILKIRAIFRYLFKLSFQIHVYLYEVLTVYSLGLQNLNINSLL